VGWDRDLHEELLSALVILDKDVTKYFVGGATESTLSHFFDQISQKYIKCIITHFIKGLVYIKSPGPFSFFILQISTLMLKNIHTQSCMIQTNQLKRVGK
jgi:hypothetical protein